MQYSEINCWNLFSLKKTEVLSIPTTTGALTTFCNALFTMTHQQFCNSLLRSPGRLRWMPPAESSISSNLSIQSPISCVPTQTHSAHLIHLLETTVSVWESLHWACHYGLSISLLCHEVHSFFVGPWESLDHSGFTLGCSTRYALDSNKVLLSTTRLQVGFVFWLPF